MAASIATIVSEVEGAYAFPVRTLQNLGVTQCAPRVVVAGAPMLLHAQPRELVVLGMALVIPGAIDQMNDAVDFAMRDLLKSFASALFFNSSGSLSMSPATACCNRCTCLN